MKTVVFELTMPNRGSWNGRWSGENRRHLLFMRMSEKNANKYNGKSWVYNWDDGWCACVEAFVIHGTSESKMLRKSNDGFCGYDWMVRSIIANGNIIAEKVN